MLAARGGRGLEFRHKDKNPRAFIQQGEELNWLEDIQEIASIKSLKCEDLLSITWLPEFNPWVCSLVLCQGPHAER